MRWLQKNQAHLIVVERARLENNSKRTRLPSKTVLLTGLLVTWGVLWLISLSLFTIRRIFKHSGVKEGEKHDHKALRDSSPLFKGLKRPRYGQCFFNPDERPAFGYLFGECVLKQSCTSRESLDEARDACLLMPSCLGVTYIPWEERYELRDSNVIKETFDGQTSYVKRCNFGDGNLQPSSDGPQTDLDEEELVEEDERSDD